jgi:hypothetical protein
MGDPAGTYRQHGCVFRIVRFFIVIIILGAGAFGGWYVYKIVVEEDMDLFEKGVVRAATDKVNEAKELLELLAPEAKDVVKGKIALAKERLMRKRNPAPTKEMGKEVGTMRSNLEGLPDAPIRPPVSTPDKPAADKPEPLMIDRPVESPENPVEPATPVEKPKIPEIPPEPEPLPLGNNRVVETAPAGETFELTPLEEKQLEAFNLVESGDKHYTDASENDWDTPNLKKAEADYRKALDLLKAAYKENPSDKTILESIQYVNTCLFDVNKQKRVE